jgi:tetratricopeptide (TPR) repeat protein
MDLVARAEHLLDVRRTDEAMRLLLRVVATDPENADAFCALSRAHLRNGDAGQSLKAAEAALARRPNDGYAAYLRATALVADKRAEGLAAAEHAVRLVPGFWPAFGTLAGALVNAGRPAEALVAARQAVALAPHEAGAHTLLGGVADDAKDRAAAETAYREALRLKPDYAPARVVLAVLHFGRWRVRTGAGHLVAAAVADPADAEVVGGLRTLVAGGLAFSVAGVAAAGLIGLMALVAGGTWARLLCGTAAVVFLAGLLYLATRLPRSARPLLRSMLRTDRSRLVPIVSAPASVLLLGGYAATGALLMLGLLLAVVITCFGWPRTRRRRGPRTPAPAHTDPAA